MVWQGVDAEMKKPFLSRIWVLVLIAALLTFAITMAAGANLTDSDPLISLSYLTGKFRTAILGDVQKAANDSVQKLQQQIDARAAQLAVSDSTPTASATHQTVSINAGETLQIKQGSELLFLSGGATANGSLNDATAGNTVSSGGALIVNHLYLATQDVTITASETMQALIG